MTGRRKVRVTDRRTAQDFAEQLRMLVDGNTRGRDDRLGDGQPQYPRPACLYERFEPAEARRIANKIEWHYTPEHGSWLNIAECELSVLAGQCLSQRIPDKPTLIREVAAWEKRRNAAHVTVDWQFTTADARIKLKRYIQF